MKKSSFFLGGALLLSTLFLTSCDKVMSKLDNPVSSYLEVGKADVVIPTGDTYQIEASTISTMPIMYESSNPEVATVDADGLVTAIADGEATITVTVEQDANKAYLAGEQKINVAVKRPLTFEALEDGQINVSFYYGITLEKPIVYTINGGTKQEITATTSIAVKKGDKVEFESANDHTAEYEPNNTIKYVNIQPQSQCAVYGNVMSMISPDGNYHTNKTITAPYALVYLLCGYYNNTDDIYCTVSHDKYDLVLPATTLNDYCYYDLLYNTGITKAPELPAEELTPYCYAYMFENCLSLETAPELRAKELKDNCYDNMFRNSGLTKAPALPAEVLAPYCYRSMFYGCKSLTEAPALPAEKMKYYCYAYMFYGCTSLTKAPELRATELKDNCYDNMFRYSGLTKAPALPAEVLAPYCYRSMFYGCTSLTEAPALPATDLVESCYLYMFGNCTKLSYLKCLAKNAIGYSVTYMLVNAGTDKSVKTRTLERDPDTYWYVVSGNWINTLYVPLGWTVTPPYEEASAPARRASASVEATPIKDNTLIMPDAGAQDRPHVQF